MERKLILGILLIQAALTGVLIEEGTYGEWKDTYHAKSGYFACGARLQYEIIDDYDELILTSGDQTAANAMKMTFCKFEEWDTQHEEGGDGLFGDWKENKMCPKDYYVSGFKARIDPYHGMDEDTMLNGVILRCSKPFTEDYEDITVY